MMLTFGQLMRPLLKRKNKLSYLFLVLGMIASAVISVWTTVSVQTGHSNMFSEGFGVRRLDIFGTFFMSFFIITITIFVLGEMIYFIASVYITEKINRSSTWRLAAISDNKFYIANILTSFLSLVYYSFLQIIVALISLGLGLVLSPDLRKGAHFSLGHISQSDLNSVITTMLLSVCLIILTNIFWYLIVGTYHFLSRTMIDFLPFANKFISVTVKLMLLIVFSYISAKSIDMLSEGHFLGVIMLINDSTPLVNQIVLISLLDAVLLILNLVLFDRFIEAKQK